MIISKPIVGDDETIKSALAQADPVLLRAIIFQLTGDTSLNAIKLDKQMFLGGYGIMGIMNPEDTARTKASAFNMLRIWRDERRLPPPAPPLSKLREIMELISGAP